MASDTMASAKLLSPEKLTNGDLANANSALLSALKSPKSAKDSTGGGGGGGGSIGKLKLSQSERLEWELYRMVMKKSHQAAQAHAAQAQVVEGMAEYGKDVEMEEDSPSPWTILNVPVSLNSGAVCLVWHGCQCLFSEYMYH